MSQTFWTEPREKTRKIHQSRLGDESGAVHLTVSEENLRSRVRGQKGDTLSLWSKIVPEPHSATCKI